MANGRLNIKVHYRVLRLGLRTIFVVACAAVSLLCAGISSHAEEPAKPYGIAQRPEWTTSHVSGSPEPPSPYETQRAFPKLTFNHPLDIAFAPGSNRIFVAQQDGKLFSFPNDPNVDHADVFFDPGDVLNLKDIPDCKGAGETFALTFHPQFQKNRYCYVEYNLAYKTRRRNNENGSRVSRFTVTDSEPPRLDPASEVIILQWLSGGHNGCCLKFGPDGFLYISMGDAADPAPPDEFNTGQDISDWLSSILRIDVDHPADGKPYSVPTDNPFIKTPGAKPEVYAYGLRNPWRMNFDSKTGNLWLGDVGWELWEMIYCIKSGGNYGWSIMEGPNPVHPNGKRGPTEISKPQAALPHSEAASITGGIVYRGTKLPELAGCYIFGDWMSNRLWAAKCSGPQADTLEPYKEIAQTDQRIVGFGEDPEHEPIVIDHGAGGLYRIVPNPAAGTISAFPRSLSATGLFVPNKNNVPETGVLPFSINAAQWLDGATAERWVATPGKSVLAWGKGTWGDDKPAWPTDSVLVRTLSLEMKSHDRASSKHIETQVLHFDGRQWHGYSYAWKDDQSDAELVGAAGSEKPFTIVDAAAPGGTRRQMWRYPSRAQCMTCHNLWADYALAFNAPQLDRIEKFKSADDAMVEDNQVRAFQHIGLLLDPYTSPDALRQKRRPPAGAEKVALSDPYDTHADLTERARSYLHVNCSHCHRNGGGGTALFDVRKELHSNEMKAINERPALGDFGLQDGKLICAGDANRSVMLYRTSKVGRGRMPQIESDIVDDKGTQMLREWFAKLEKPADKQPVDSLELAREVDILRLSDGQLSDAAIASLLNSPSGAMALLGEVQAGRISDKVVLAKALASPMENVRDLFRRYDPREQFIERLGTNIDRVKLAGMPGDAARGRKVFDSSSDTSGGAAQTGLCASCHRINGAGKDFGPDLSHIAMKYTKAQVLESIIEPSKTIAEGYTTYVLKTKAGDRITGFVVSKTDKEILFRDAQKEYRIPAADVDKLSPQTISAMPEGLLSNVSPQEAADLLEFLSTLK